MTSVTSTASATLAIFGGAPVRAEPMPPRRAIGAAERSMIARALDYYAARDADFGYQGHFEDLYCQAFTCLMGGGHADVVATGTLALFTALAALDLAKGSEVLVWPITDPGGVSPVIFNRLVPRLVDSAPGSYNAGPEQVERRISERTRAVIVTHAAGQAAPIGPIVEVARRRDLRIVEDCSQSHGARWQGSQVGSFGDIAAFSTMYRKPSITGGCGGVVYTRDEELHRRALAFADRGKPRWRVDFDDRDPSGYLFPALNMHADELSCAIGLASIERLGDTIARRMAFVRELAGRIEEESAVCSPYPWNDGDSPFFYPVVVDPSRIGCTKRQFAEAVRAEGIGLNPHYMYVVRDWPWLERHLGDACDTPNARDVRDRTMCLYLNENYTSREVDDIIEAILKVEHHFCK